MSCFRKWMAGVVMTGGLLAIAGCSSESSTEGVPVEEGNPATDPDAQMGQMENMMGQPGMMMQGDGSGMEGMPGGGGGPGPGGPPGGQ